MERGANLLLQAVMLAGQVERDPWDFAVEIGALQGAGMSNSDLRWMICKGFVEHAYEQTEAQAANRRFRANGELAFSDRSCFVLTDAGQQFARELAEAIQSLKRGDLNGSAVNLEINGKYSTVEIPTHISSPTWDSGRHQLRVGDVIVKEFKLPSPNQETILAAFEEEHWPPSIDDPLPVHPDLDPRRRLHDTIKSLNRNQRCVLIRFMGDGTGEGVRWEWTKRH
jgi:hypothetical protein